MEEIKIKVMFGSNIDIGGTLYGKGVYELSPEKARACVAKGGVISPQDKKRLEQLAEEESFEGAPLSFEETVQRFQAMDFSDEVMRSMQYHQTEFQARFGAPQVAPTYGKDATAGESTKEVIEPKTPPVEKTAPLGSGAPSGETGATGETDNGKEGAPSEEGIDLPAELPFRAELIAGNVKTLAELKAMNKKQILEVPEIGDAKANKIGAWLAANSGE